MSKPFRVTQDQYKLEQAVWDTQSRILQTRGIDFPGVLLAWSRTQRDSLTSSHARIEFDELCKHGCVLQVLAGILALIRNSSEVAVAWTMIVGPRKERGRVAYTLEQAVVTLERLFGDFIAVEDEKQKKAMTDIGRIPFSMVVSELKYYVNFINLAERFAAHTETSSPAELTRYLLASYVKRATGKFRDRNVSTLLAETMDLTEYDEVAQRMWRSRNYRRLDKHFSKLTEFLFAMGVVVSRKT